MQGYLYAVDLYPSTTILLSNVKLMIMTICVLEIELDIKKKRKWETSKIIVEPIEKYASNQSNF